MDISLDFRIRLRQIIPLEFRPIENDEFEYFKLERQTPFLSNFSTTKLQLTGSIFDF